MDECNVCGYWDPQFYCDGCGALVCSTECYEDHVWEYH